MTLLALNDGRFGGNDDRKGEEGPPEDLHKQGHRFSAEMPYETRYFSVFLKQDGSVTAVNTGKIAAVDTAAAVEYAQTVAASQRAKGFVDHYRYIVYSVGAETHMIFLDCGREISAFRTFLLTTAGVSGAGLAAVMLLLIVLSNRIVKPFSENYEKQKQFITDAGHELKTRGKTLTGNIQPMLSMCGDEKAVRQLMVILLDNAVKYSDEDGRIELTLEKKKGCIRLSVFNTAEFVSNENLPRFFDRFYRADQSRNSQTGGYGLGLSMASAIVHAHKGKISASTQDEKSLLITVVFPT